MIKINTLFTLILICTIFSCRCKTEDEINTPEEETKIVYPANKYQVVGYLRESLIDKIQANTLNHLTHLYLIGGVYGDSTEIVRFVDKQNTIKNIQILKEYRGRKNVKLILSVAGHFKPHYFKFAKDKSKRTKYIQTLLNFCLENELDGIDIDAEHPENKEEIPVMEQLAKEIYEAFHPKGLSVSHAIIFYNTQYSKAVLPYVDWINLMLYDMMDSNGYHATYEDYLKFIKRHVDTGIPHSKLVAGLPFYGVNITKDKSKLIQMGYKQLVEQYATTFDPSSDVLGIYAFNGIKTIQKKVQYAAENEMAGVMFWSLGLDFTPASNKSLLKAIVEVTPVEN